jgi:hypothetical protein
VQRIKIFLASSSELKADRDAFEIFIGRENKKRTKNNQFLELILWEDFLDALSPHGLQTEYNQAIQACDIFVMLFFTKVGKYTAQEFETAIGAFREGGKPLIYTYFKEGTINVGTTNREDLQSLWAFQDKLKALKHYQTAYKNTDELLLKFKGQLEHYFAGLPPATAPTPLPPSKPTQTHSGTGDNIAGDKIQTQINVQPQSKEQAPQSSTHNPGYIPTRTIVLLGANPKGFAQLRIGEEFRRINAAISKGKPRGKLKILKSEENVTTQSLVHWVGQQPDIIHFSGYGSEGGIYLIGENGSKQLFSKTALKLLMKQLKGCDSTILLNTGKTGSLAYEISAPGMYVIGFIDPVSDKDAITFAETFYQALSNGKTIPEAYRDGVVVTMTQSSGFEENIGMWKDGREIEI